MCSHSFITGSRALYLAFTSSSVSYLTLSVGLLGRVNSPSQGRYLHTEQHKHRINLYTNIHILSGIRTHDPSVRANEDSSCVRPLGHRDRLCTLRSVTLGSGKVVVRYGGISLSGGHYFIIPSTSSTVSNLFSGRF
jgi:hypothetical protein